MKAFEEGSRCYEFVQLQLSLQDYENIVSNITCTEGENSAYIDLDDYVDFEEQDDIVDRMIACYPDVKLIEIYV